MRIFLSALVVQGNVKDNTIQFSVSNSVLESKKPDSRDELLSMSDSFCREKGSKIHRLLPHRCEWVVSGAMMGSMESTQRFTVGTPATRDRKKTSARSKAFNIDDWR